MKFKSFLLITAICISTMLVVKHNEFKLGLLTSEQVTTENLLGSNHIPSYILDSFNNDSLAIYEVNDSKMKKLCNLSEDVTRLGSYHSNVGILINSSNTAFEETTVIHEFGHYFDEMNANISSSDKFEALFSKEGSLGTEYGSTSSLEFFAESFTAYLVHINNIASSYDYETMYESCPETMEFISDLLVD